RPLACDGRGAAPRAARPDTESARRRMTSAGSVGGDERLRLFLALELPPTTRDDLTAWGSAHLSGGRIVAREHLHVTLAFLGSRPAVEVEAILRVLRDAVAAGSESIVLQPKRCRG